MKLNGKTEAKRELEEFFRKDKFSSKDVRKIKKLAMRYRIRLGDNRKRFCKKCFAKLDGRVRIGKVYKTVKCGSCGFVNRWKLVGKKA